jgi:muramoyltetrapeptide carboxypeptidase
VAALSGAIDPAKLDAGIAYLKSRGYRVVEARNLRTVRGDFSGDDRERAAGYRELLLEGDVAAIFFARGGWGASRTLAHLDAEEISAHPKIHMGGSDLASFFSFVRRQTGLVGFHGPMVAVDFAASPPDSETDRTWEPLLSGGTFDYRIDPADCLRPGRAEGLLVGGCLSLLVSLEGTPDAVETEGAILFWEDVHEELYRIDRMLTQLHRAGRLDCVAGVIIGSLEEIRHNGKRDDDALASLLQEHFGRNAGPVVRNWPSGHGRRNRALPLGARVVLDADSGRLTLPEPAVL